MNQIILSGIQITISIWEMWMCYEILYMTVLDKKYADKKETIIRWANIFVVGSLLGINRLIAFFSRTMLGLVVILTIMCMYGIKRKKVVLSAGIVFVYFEFIAILDFILAFISMEFIKEQFEHVIYIYALTWQKVLIYFFTRGIILLGIVNIKKREESIRSMIEQCCGIIVITGALLCAVLFKYQLWLDEMANGSKPIRGINASMNLCMNNKVLFLNMSNIEDITLSDFDADTPSGKNWDEHVSCGEIPLVVYEALEDYEENSQVTLYNDTENSTELYKYLMEYVRKNGWTEEDIFQLLNTSVFYYLDGRKKSTIIDFYQDSDDIIETIEMVYGYDFTDIEQNFMFYIDAHDETENFVNLKGISMMELPLLKVEEEIFRRNDQ